MTDHVFLTQRSPIDTRDWRYEAMPHLMEAGGELPEAFDWKNKLFPVRDQRARGCCAAFSAATIKEVHEELDNPDLFDGYISPESIYFYRENKGTAQSEGMNLKDTFKILAKYGACRERFFPYGDSEPSSIPREAQEDAIKFKIGGYAQISTIDAAKRAIINNGPLQVAFPYYNNGMNEFWRPTHGSVQLGGHACAIVGYNKDGFIIRNSWGPNWGDHGHILWLFSEFGLHWEIFSATDLHSDLTPGAVQDPIPEYEPPQPPAPPPPPSGRRPAPRPRPKPAPKPRPAPRRKSAPRR